MNLGNQKTLKTGEFPQVEEALYTWFHQQQRRNAPISGDVLREKAKVFMKKLQKTNIFEAVLVGWTIFKNDWYSFSSNERRKTFCR